MICVDWYDAHLNRFGHKELADFIEAETFVESLEATNRNRKIRNGLDLDTIIDIEIYDPFDVTD